MLYNTFGQSASQMAQNRTRPVGFTAKAEVVWTFRHYGWTYRLLFQGATPRDCRNAQDGRLPHTVSRDAGKAGASA